MLVTPIIYGRESASGARTDEPTEKGTSFFQEILDEETTAGLPSYCAESNEPEKLIITNLCEEKSDHVFREAIAFKTLDTKKNPPSQEFGTVKRLKNELLPSNELSNFCNNSAGGVDSILKFTEIISDWSEITRSSFLEKPTYHINRTNPKSGIQAGSEKPEYCNYNEVNLDILAPHTDEIRYLLGNVSNPNRSLRENETREISRHLSATQEGSVPKALSLLKHNYSLPGAEETSASQAVEDSESRSALGPKNSSACDGLESVNDKAVSARARPGENDDSSIIKSSRGNVSSSPSLIPDNVTLPNALKRETDVGQRERVTGVSPSVDDSSDGKLSLMTELRRGQDGTRDFISALSDRSTNSDPRGSAQNSQVSLEDTEFRSTSIPRDRAHKTDPSPEIGSFGHDFSLRSDFRPHAASPDGALKSTQVARAVLDQVFEALQQRVDGRLELRLEPEELGRLRISISGHETAQSIQISAERADTADLLRRHLTLLRSELANGASAQLDVSQGRDFGRSGDSKPSSEQPTSDLEISETEVQAHPVRRTGSAASGIDLRL
ncbi:flagellar hook-length control protein FliK [Litorisediminicola beolgyonensis]|uniref:Flagellar hook-length control protein FliK n=1 Tax=Litorisediminicola beolgyonensis TaxID=1173614 RepID=A0ABW3ZGQ6_9RHOB